MLILRCGGLRNRLSRTCVLDCAHSSSSVHVHSGSREEMSLSLINRMENSPGCGQIQRKAPESFSFRLISTNISDYCWKCCVSKHSLCWFLANRLFVVLRPHFPTWLMWSSITQRELHFPLLQLPCQQRHEQEQSLAPPPRPWCPLHLFFSGAQKPKRCPGLGLFYAFLSSVFFTVIALLVKTIQGVHAIEISAIRCFFQMLFVVPLLIYKKWVT